MTSLRRSVRIRAVNDMMDGLDADDLAAGACQGARIFENVWCCSWCQHRPAGTTIASTDLHHEVITGVGVLQVEPHHGPAINASAAAYKGVPEY